MSYKYSGIAVALAFVCFSGCGGGGGGGNDPPPPPPTPLRATGSVPTDGATGVDPTRGLTINFDSSVKVASVLPASVQLSDGSGTIPASFAVDGATIKITPASPLKLGVTYRITVKSGIQATSGGALQNDFSSAFTTAVAFFTAKNLAPADITLGGSFYPMIAAGDMNGDGRIDVVEMGRLPPGMSSEGYRLNLYLQNAQGSFDKFQEIDYQFPNSPYQKTFASVVVTDFEGDGVPEIVVPESRSDGVESGFRIFRRGIDGRYGAAEFVSTPYVRAVHALDVDGDGKLDFIGGPFEGSFQVFLNRGGSLQPSGLITYPTQAFDFEFAAADMNRDGKREILMLYEDSTARRSKVTAFSRDAQGNLMQDAPLTQVLDSVCADYQKCSSMAAIDIDNDGWPDFVFGTVQPDIVSAYYLRQPGGGAFVRGLQTQFGAGQAVLMVTDMNRDGLADLVIVDNSLSHDITAAALGKGAADFDYSPAFALPTYVTLYPQAVAIADMNGDGYPDVLVDGLDSGISAMLQSRF